MMPSVSTGSDSRSCLPQTNVPPCGNWYGWGRVLDYIGVEWRDPEVALINAAEQITMDDAIRYLAAKAAE